jgi:hypothetical protein
MGGLCGFILAIFFRKQGPPKKEYDFGDEDDDEDEADDNPSGNGKSPDPGNSDFTLPEYTVESGDKRNR